jgi:hypothetical protein
MRETIQGGPGGSMGIREIVEAALQQLDQRGKRMELNEFGRWVSHACSLALDRGVFREAEIPTDSSDFIRRVIRLIFELDPEQRLIAPPLEALH